MWPGEQFIADHEAKVERQMQEGYHVSETLMKRDDQVGLRPIDQF